MSCKTKDAHWPIVKPQASGHPVPYEVCLIFQPTVLTSQREILPHLPSQHHLCVLQGLVVQQPVQLCPLCRGVAVFVLHVWRMVQFLLEIHQKKKPETSRYIKKFQALFRLNWKFTAQSASSWGQVKESSHRALFSFISLLMRLPFSCSRTSPYAALHNLPAIWCKSGVVVGVVDFRPKCPVCRSDLQRNGLWLPWWLLRKSPSWC